MVVVISSISCYADYYKECRNLGSDENHKCMLELKRADQSVTAAEQLVESQEYEAAEVFLNEAMQIRRRFLGADRAEVAEVWLQLSRSHRARGLVAQAVVARKKAEKIFSQAYDYQPELYAEKLMEIAQEYRNGGNTSSAEIPLRRAIDKLSSTLGVKHPKVAIAHVKLAINLVDTKDYFDAEQNLQYAIEILEKESGSTHEATLGLAYLTLAEIYNKRGDASGAERVLLNALPKIEHRSFYGGQISMRLVRFYVEQDRYKEAEKYINRLQNTYNFYSTQPINPCRIFNMRNIAFWRGFFYEKRGQLDQAMAKYQSSISMARNRYGQLSDAVLIELRDSVAGLARMLFRKGNNKGALELFYLSAELHDNSIRQYELSRTEDEFADQLDDITHFDDEILSLSYTSRDNELAKLGLSLVLMHQGRVSDVTSDMLMTIQEGISESDRQLLVQLRTLRSRLSELALSGPINETAEQFEQRLQHVKHQADRLEEDLANRAVLTGAHYRFSNIRNAVKAIASQLPKNSTLINYVNYTYRPIVENLPSSLRSKEGRYLAFILKPDASIAVVDLGLASAIDSASSQLHDALSSKSVQYGQKSHELYKLIIAPLKEALGDKDQIYVVPDGQLNIIPFQVLNDGQQLLGDRVRISYLSSGRDLLRRQQNLKVANNVVIFADPDFSYSDEHQAISPPTLLTQIEESRSVIATRRGRGFHLEGLDPLPGTWAEAQDIQRMLPSAKILRGSEATERALIGIENPGILHIATHGVFLGEVKAEASPSLYDAAKGMGVTNPMLRSALVLSGAAALRSANSKRSDGLVTAMELSGLNLRGTQLVVLSACDSGRGTVRTGQGVYGLRRAFLTAGAETVVTSLWRVSDFATKELMGTYYQHLLNGMSRSDAMLKASLELRQKYAHPYYWSSFIVIGSDAPLRGFSMNSK